MEELNSNFELEPAENIIVEEEHEELSFDQENVTVTITEDEDEVDGEIIEHHGDFDEATMEIHISDDQFQILPQLVTVVTTVESIMPVESLSNSSQEPQLEIIRVFKETPDGRLNEETGVLIEEIENDDENIEMEEVSVSERILNSKDDENSEILFERVNDSSDEIANYKIINKEEILNRKKALLINEKGYLEPQNKSQDIKKYEKVKVELDAKIYQEEDEASSNSDSEEFLIRKCVVCIRQRKFTEDIFDSSKQIISHIEMLLAYLSIKIKKLKANYSSNYGICHDCMNHLQRWHIFNSAVAKRHENINLISNEINNDPIPFESIEAKIYRNYKKISKVKDIYLSATHAHYTRRHLTEKDWDFFCDHLFSSNSVKSEKSRELEKFLNSREKLSHMFCIKCQILLSGGKRGFAKHMKDEHGQRPIMYPCEICGAHFPDKDMTASTEDYYPHWISHFYFNKCEDCGKSFPTKRALGQHRHAVHKNRQEKCNKCGKILANKMSLDLHLLRHLPENEKKKYLIKCNICKKRIAQWNLKSHLASHNEVRPWKCDHCNSSFKMKGALVSHRDVVHFNLKNHVCSICSEAFKSASSLKGHVRRHEGKKDFKCDVCLKEYYTYSALKGHKVVHQTARNFICDICKKAFKKKKALEEHETIHTGKKPYGCPICGREIRVKSNLYKHLKIHKKSNDDSHGHANTKSSKKKVINEEIEGENEIIIESSSDNTELSTIMIGISNDDVSTVSTVITSNTSVSSNHSIIEGSYQGKQVHLQHQHQDLLNVSVTNFYNHSQYFNSLH